MSEQSRPVVIVSNRGPLSYRFDGDALVARRGSGGLVSGLAPLVDSGRATWIAAAMSDADRAAAARPTAARPDSVERAVTLLDIDPEDQRLAYDVISNETLWFVHHGLFDLVRTPAFGRDWTRAWEAYRRFNHRFAEAVCELAPERAVVMVQDYHLTLLAPTVRRRRPDLSLVHFHHTPFGGPDSIRVLPTVARDEMLEALAAHHACGFHTQIWADNFVEVQRRYQPHIDAPTVFAASLSTDADDLRSTASSAACDTAFAAIDSAVGERQLIVRVDRMELSKNIVRGFDAYELMLAEHPEMCGQVEFLACCYPSRENVPAYARYRSEVEAAVDRVNERFGTADWQPVRLEVDDNYPRSVAALRRYDLLLVNPIRDGLNLVAKEGPLINERDGQVVLSYEAGAWEELRGSAHGVSPFDVAETAETMAWLLQLSHEDRAASSTWLRERVGERTPIDWFNDQIAAVS